MCICVHNMHSGLSLCEAGMSCAVTAYCLNNQLKDSVNDVGMVP